MSSLNRIILVGEVQDTPEVRATESGSQFAKFNLSVNRPARQDGMVQQPDIIPIVAWGDRADDASTLLANSQAYIEGRVTTRTTEDANGKRQYFTEVDARDIQNLGETSAAPAAPAMPMETPAREIESKSVEEVSESDFNFDENVPKAEGEGLAQPEQFEAEAEEEVPF